jgi:hypothetical protein
MLDCIAGIAIGTALWWVKVSYGTILESFVMSGSMWAPLLVLAVTILLIRIHPEPADACCKCFEDGVAFAGVFVGVKFGQWRNPVLNSTGVGHQISFHEPVVILLFKTSLQITLGSDPPYSSTTNLKGVSALLGWRAATKPLLHRLLPPLYRLLEKARLDMPRRYFIRAS